jgi:5'-deoxynucleotidase YfbR-like HD superfamily hydrolase
MGKRFAMASGRLIDINNFTSADVCLDDIAHHLAKIQRGNGCLPLGTSYSVAEHSINLCNSVEPKWYSKLFRCKAILHDASEAYLSDIVSPVKRQLPEYLELEFNIQSIIYNKYIGVAASKHDTVLEEKDHKILIDEIETMLPEQLELYRTETGLEKLGCHISYNNDEHTVKAVFLNMCKKLGISD